MFGLDCFAHANDNTKSIFMLLLRRRDLERRALQLTHVRRGDIKSIRAQGSTVADSAVFYAVHWEEGGAWDTETVLRSVREDVKGWPFSRQWCTEPVGAVLP